MSETVIEVRDLNFAYGAQPVLSDLHFDIRRGDFVAVVGPNGGGKTTLVRLILGLLQPDTGSIRVLGAEPREGRGRIGSMPQHTQIDPLFPLSVREAVLMGRLGRGPRLGPWRNRDRDAAAAALAAVGAEDLIDRSLADLSGGQRQRVLLARALAGDAELLILDEPTAALDPKVQDEIYALLAEVGRTRTVLMVSHDVSMVAKSASRVLCVDGTLTEHCLTEIPEDWRELFYGPRAVRLVRHDHDHSESHDHEAEGHRCE